MWSSANVLADHWAEMLSVEVQQVNEVRGVDEYLRRLLAINPDCTHRPESANSQRVKLPVFIK